MHGSLKHKRFTTNDQGFVCLHCGAVVVPLGISSRNHCPFCLYSLHVDRNPGDRACKCGGLMEPVSVEYRGSKGYVLVHRCLSCGALRRNRAAVDAPHQPDSMERILALASDCPAPPDRSGPGRRRRDGRNHRRSR